jgi:hypothetical protein
VEERGHTSAHAEASVGFGGLSRLFDRHPRWRRALIVGGPILLVAAIVWAVVKFESLQDSPDVAQQVARFITFAAAALLVTLLAVWVVRGGRNQTIFVQALENVSGRPELHGQAISDLLVVEMQHVADLCTREASWTQGIVKPQRKAQDRLRQPFVQAGLPLEGAVQRIGVVEASSWKIPVGSLMGALRELWPATPEDRILTGSVACYGSDVRIVLRLTKGQLPGLAAWDVSGTARTSAELKSLVHSLALKACHDIWGRDLARTIEGFRAYVRCRESAWNYGVAGDPRQLQTACEFVDAATFNEGILRPHWSDLLEFLGNSLLVEGDFDACETMLGLNLDTLDNFRSASSTPAEKAKIEFDMAQSWARLGNVAYFRHDYEASYSCFLQAADLSGDRDESLWYSCGYMAGMIWKQDKSVNEEYFSIAKTLLAAPQRTTPKEKKPFKETVPSDNAFAQHVSLAELYRAKGDSKAMEDELVAAMRFFVGSDAYDYGCWLAIAGDFPGAVAAVKQALADNQVTIEWVEADGDLDALREGEPDGYQSLFS